MNSKVCWAIAIIVVVSASVYSNAINSKFVFDDFAAVIRNSDTNPDHPLADILRNDFWGNNISSPSSHKSYRPITVWTFRLNRLAAEGWSGNFSSVQNGETQFHHAPQEIAPSFHAVNVVLHAVVSALVFVVAFYIICPGDFFASVVSGTVFAVHPVHTEAVAGVVGRADLLAAMFGTAAHLAYSRSARENGTSWGWIAVTVSLVTVSTLSKEVGLMVIAALVFHEVLLVDESTKSIASAFGRIRDRKRAIPMFSRLTVLGATGIGLLSFRKWLTVTFIVPGIRHVENPIAYTQGLDRILNLGLLHSKYMQLLIAPTTLSADWSYNCIPLISSVSDPRNAFGVIMYASLAAIAIVCAVNLSTGRRFLVPLSWMGATFFPSMNILFFVGTMVGERLLYVPSVGFCVVVGMAASSLVRSSRPWLVRAIVASVLLSAVAWFSAKTYTRNFDWKDDYSVYRSALESCPSSAKAQMLVGQELQVQGFWKECIPYLQRALEIEPDFCETAYSLGVAQYRTGEIFPGLRLIQRGVRCNFTTSFAIKSLFGMYSDLIRLFPEEELVLRGYAELLEQTGQRTDAATAYYGLGKKMWDRDDRKSKESGLSYVQKAADLLPEHCELQFWAGQMCLDVGHLEEAAEYLENASWQYNCSSTYIVALDRLVGVYATLSERSPTEYQRRQFLMMIRARSAAADVARKNKQADRKTDTTEPQSNP